MPHPEKNLPSDESSEPEIPPERSTLLVGRFKTEQGKTVEVYGDRIVIKSPSLRVENHLTLSSTEASILADLLLVAIQRENGRTDHDNEVVT